MLSYVNNQFIDSGLEVLRAFAGVPTLEDIQTNHIEQFSDYVLNIYISQPMIGYLAFVIFPNPSFGNPALINKPQFDAKRREILRGLLQLWRWHAGDPLPEGEEAADSNERCVFSGDPAVIRISQSLMPMIGGRDIINFFPEGRPRLPISGWCLLAMLAMPLATLNAGGKAFLPYTFDHMVLRNLVERNLRRNLDAFGMQDLDKRPNYRFPKTNLIADLVDTGLKAGRNSSITAYHFVSGGQSPSIDIYNLPSQITDFVSIASRQYKQAWNVIAARANDIQQIVVEKVENGKKTIEYPQHNFFYEDLFNLPLRARRFLRLYLLRQPRRKDLKKGDPRLNYSVIKEREVISWEMIKLFLEKVMEMDRTRVDAIKQLGDRLATYVQEVDAHLLGRLYRARNDYQMRLELIKAAYDSRGTSFANLLPFDEFIKVFFNDDGETVQADWYLARDLLIIRVIEQVNAQWLASNVSEEELTRDDETEND